MNDSNQLVYGILNDNLVLLPEDVAKAYAADHERIWALATYGDARRFNPQGMNVAPGIDEEDYDEIPEDDHPYDAALTNEYLNGAWPPPAATIALGHLPSDLADVGEERDHFPGFPNLYIDPITEVDLIEKLRQRGYEVRRDDELIKRI